MLPCCSPTGATPAVESSVPVLTHTPTPSLLPTLGTDNSPARGSSAGAIAGALVGVVLVVVVTVLVVLLVVLVLRRRKNKQLHAVNTEQRVLDNSVHAGILLLLIKCNVLSTCTGAKKLQFICHGSGYDST